MRYALIVNGIVDNFIHLHPLNAEAFENAFPVNGLPVAVGDVYSNGKFYRNGEEIKPDEPEGDEDMAAALEMLEVRMNG